MSYKYIGIIGPGAHYRKNIEPLLKKSKFFKIQGFLKKTKTKQKNFFNEKEFFKKKFDFVYISCPNELHEKFILKSLSAGFHVICEKPFVTKKKNINKIINLSTVKKKLIFEAMMYAYHPVFEYIKKTIKEKKYGRIKYIISNFKFPSIDKPNNRYLKNEGNGFFFDAAVYPVSIEHYLFKFKSLNKISQQIIRNKVDLRGNILIESNKIKRFYFWGEGQNYSNNLEIHFEKSTLYVDKFFSKYTNENIYAEIHTPNKIIIKKFKKINHFNEMLNIIKNNYFNLDFQKRNRKLIEDQVNLLDIIRSA